MHLNDKLTGIRFLAIFSQLFFTQKYLPSSWLATGDEWLSTDLMHLTDEQWQLVQPFLPLPSPGIGRGAGGEGAGRGRPPIDERRALDGILCKLRNRLPWYDLPQGYPSHQTCYRRYRLWKRLGVLDALLAALYRDLCQRGGFDIQQALNDGSIRLELEAGRLQWVIDPLSEGDWRLSTAMLFLRLVEKRLKHPAP